MLNNVEYFRGADWGNAGYVQLKRDICTITYSYYSAQITGYSDVEQIQQVEWRKRRMKKKILNKFIFTDLFYFVEQTVQFYYLKTILPW